MLGWGSWVTCPISWGSHNSSFAGLGPNIRYCQCVYWGLRERGAKETEPGPNFKINLILSKIADIFLRYRYCDVIWQTFPSRHLFDQIINTELPHPVKVELPSSRYAHVRLCSDKGNWNVDNRIETNPHSFTSKNMSCKYVKWLL